MLLALVVVASLSLLSLWAVAGLCALGIYRLERRTRDALVAAARAIIEPASEGQPSLLAVYSDQVATLFAGRIVQQLKTAAGGVASGISADVQQQAMAGMAAQSPWMALLAGLLPKKFRNQLLSSPQFVGQLGALAGGGSGNHQEQSSVQSRLKLNE